MNATSTSAFEPRVRSTIGYRDLLALVHHPDVAAVSLADYVDTRPSEHDPQAIDLAERNGTVEVLLFLADTQHHQGLSAVEFEQRKVTNRRALASVLTDHSIFRAHQDLASFGAINVKLTAAELRRLMTSADRRIRGTAVNRPMGGASLATSTVQMNLGPTWGLDDALFPPTIYPDAGFRGAYPSIFGNPASSGVPIKIIVYDTGVKKSHPMFANKISFETCFGTNFDQPPASPIGTTTAWRSICPHPDYPDPATNPTGDSPLGSYGGAGEPSPLGMQCAMLSSSGSCAHGTHVASVAAGRTSGRNGVAPAATIVPVQVFSFDANPVRQQRRGPNWFGMDLLAGLNAVLPYLTPNTQENDFVINLSLGTSGLARAVPCTSGQIQNPDPTLPPGYWPPNEPMVDAFVVAIQMLRDRGTPVIVAAGNEYPDGLQFMPGPNGLNFPACLPGTIKVGASANSLSSWTRAAYSNAPELANFLGEYFWVAPGGLDQPTGIDAAWIEDVNGAPYEKATGTSNAAPHVAGAYAMLKAGYRKVGVPFTVNGASDWFRGSASIEVEWSFNGGINSTYRAIRFQ